MQERHPVYALGDALVEAIADHRPATATIWGLPGRDHRWDDLSPDGMAAWRDMLADAKRRVDALPPPNDRWDDLAAYVLRDHLTRELEAVDRGDPLVHLAHIASPFQGFHLTLAHMDTTTDEGRDAVLTRLETLGPALDGYRRTLQQGLDRGRRVAARQVRSVVQQGRAYADTRAFYRLTAGSRDPVRAEAAAVRAHAAYAGLVDWLASSYLPHATPTDGVGVERYHPAARAFLGADLDLDETLAWGWDEVERLRGQMRMLLDDVAPGLSLAQAVDRWRRDPATTAPNPETFLERIRAWQRDAMARLADVLPVPESVRALHIERGPPGSPPGAWYFPPSEDLRRPGTIQYSFLDGPIPLFDQQSTAYHEGFPGHHLQLGIQRTLPLSRFHRVAVHYTGFSEGWALYAEQLMDEHGFYEDPVMRLGYLVNQIARACRVVLDIGAHIGRDIPRNASFEPGQPWTFERGVAFMTEVGGLRPEVSTSEVTRYLGWPGQAISYKVGQKVILDLRRDAGDRVEFHRRLLGAGTVGLDRARREVLGR